MKKKILFRADGNSNTGLGHLFRAFALIEMYKDTHEYVFLTRSDSTIEVIPDEYNIDIIPASISIRDEVSWLNQKFSEKEYILIADGYQFNSLYQKEIKLRGYKMMYVDDLATEFMYADIVINHSPHVSEEDFMTAKYTQFALGTEYAILRPKFLKKAKDNKEIESINNVFVCFGGADFYDLTYKCLSGIINLNQVKQIHVVLGGAYKHENIFELTEKYKDRIIIHRNLSEEEMIELMEQCELGIIPSSTISYEVCSVKMLIFSGYYVDNQVNINKGFEEQGLIYNVGDFNLLSSKGFKDKVVEIINDSSENYSKMLENQKRVFNGNQKNNFLELINKL